MKLLLLCLLAQALERPLGLGHVRSTSSIATATYLPHVYMDTWYLWTRYPCVSVDQIFMGVCRPDIYGCLVTRYLWVSVIFLLPEGKAVGIFLIAVPVLLIFLKSLLTIHNLFRPLGKPVSKFLIAIPVLVIFLKSLFTIHGVLRPSRTTIHSNPIHFICFSNFH